MVATKRQKKSISHPEGEKEALQGGESAFGGLGRSGSVSNNTSLRLVVVVLLFA